MQDKILFKYKPVVSVEQLARILDSLKNNRLYFPTYKELNDPLESSGYIIKLGGYAGISIPLNADDEDSRISSIRRQFRILSLSQNCFSPSMWAHYTNEYRGICIGYWREKSFSSARKLTYIDSPVKFQDDEGTEQLDHLCLEEYVQDSFFFKHSDWCYEEEWRIVEKQQDKFFHFNYDEIACIIIGHNLQPEIREIIRNCVSDKMPMFYTKIGFRSFGIDLLPINYQLQYDGSLPPFIRNSQELIENITREGACLIT